WPPPRRGSRWRTSSFAGSRRSTIHGQSNPRRVERRWASEAAIAPGAGDGDRSSMRVISVAAAISIALASLSALPRVTREQAPARGGEAYGFTFSVSDEARGRVAVVRAGEHVALVIASWPMGAPPAVAEDVEAMIGSLGPPPNSLPPGVF